MIDGNKDGLISAQEIQTFVDNSTAIGLPEAGAMARLLGGNACASGNGFTFFLHQASPDQPDALQRRFNFFDYASDGQINGVISIDQFKMLAKNLLPVPDAVPWQLTASDPRRTANPLDPTAQRNFLRNLQHPSPRSSGCPRARSSGTGTSRRPGSMSTRAWPRRTRRRSIPVPSAGETAGQAEEDDPDLVEQHDANEYDPDPGSGSLHHRSTSLEHAGADDRNR